MKRALLAVALIALYVLHQDFWFWRTAKPLVLGFLPIGLFYHACYTLIVALVLAVLVRVAWPSELDMGLEHDDLSRADEVESGRGGEGA